jgi:hypothetical protein
MEPSGIKLCPFDNYVLPISPGGTLAAVRGICAGAAAVWIKRGLRTGAAVIDIASINMEMRVAQSNYENKLNFDDGANMEQALEDLFLLLLPNSIANRNKWVFQNNAAIAADYMKKIADKPAFYYLAMHMEENAHMMGFCSLSGQFTTFDPNFGVYQQINQQSFVRETSIFLRGEYAEYPTILVMECGLLPSS